MTTDVYFTPKEAPDVEYWPSLIPTQDVAPAASSRVWVDTSTVPPTLKGWNGTGWVAIGGGTSLTTEDVDDRVAALITAGTGITKTYDDAAGTLTLAASSGGSSGPNPIRLGAGATTPTGVPSGVCFRDNYADEIHYYPVTVQGPVTLASISVEVTTAETGTGAGALAIYADGAGSYPGARLVDLGTFNVSTTGFKTIATTQALTAGTYWLAVSFRGTFANFRLRGTPMGPQALLPFGSTPSGPEVKRVDAAASFPATATATGGVANHDAPTFWIKVS